MCATDAFLAALPKVELHVHVEGTLEAEMLLELAERNRVSLPFDSVEQVRAAYEFADLQSFLDLYYSAAQVLLTARDFHELAWAYLKRCRDHAVRHTEIFFDPRTHTKRGVAFAQMMDGLDSALVRAEAELGITSHLILCFQRHESEAAALETLEAARPHRDRIVGVGLDSSELGHPPEKFRHVFARARSEGYRTVAHAGEEGPAEYVRQALDVLGVERIDHGVRCVEDPELVDRLARDRVPLTVCPLSNVRLQVVRRIEEHCLGQLIERGLCVTVNSDDPAFFGGYLGENLALVSRTFQLREDDLRQLSRNAVEASFAPDDRKRELLAAIEACPSGGTDVAGPGS